MVTKDSAAAAPTSHQPSSNVSSWLVCYEQRPDALVRLFCFPHGGGGPHAFRAWSSEFDENVEVYSLSLPGRGNRQHEPVITDMSVLATSIADALIPYLDKPYALFGHSVGALVSYEVAQRLAKKGAPAPLHSFFSAHTAPHLAIPDEGEAMYKLSDDDLAKVICNLGLVPQEALENEELVQLLLQPIRADFALSETYKFNGAKPFEHNITALGGLGDEILDKEDMVAWKKYTASKFEVKMYDGGHFYTQTKQDEVLKYIAGILKVELDTLPKSVVMGKKEDYPLNKCLHELFSEQAIKTPDAIAVASVHTKLTFKQLDEKTDLLARYLRSKGAGVNRAVGIYMERCASYVIAYIAIHKAGAGYLPLETGYPIMLLEKTIRTAKPPVVLTKKAFFNNLPDEVKQPTNRVLSMDKDWEKVLEAKNLPPIDEDKEAHHSDMPAYFIMTSGTTGVPKGIRCPHRGAVNSYYWRYHHHPYEGIEREACNVFFVWEVMRPILKGSTAYVIPDDVIYDPRRLISYLNKYKINRVLFTPSLLEQILATPSVNFKERLPELKIVYLNGEVVTMTLVKKFFEQLPGVSMVNDYSISECHDVCTHDLGNIDQSLSPKYAPIGEPMSNVNIYILDEEMNAVPRGCMGEIYVGGDSVALDYLNEPVKTAERFLPDHLVGNGKMFRTGDGGRILPNGYLEVTGRIQFMIKIRGYSVVMSAVEAAIAEHPSVNAALVQAHNNPATGQPDFLIGFVVGNGRTPSEVLMKQLRPFMKDRVPHYALPSYFIPIPELPLNTVTGKVDPKKLPKFEDLKLQIDMAKSKRSSPKTDIEKKIAEVWKVVLGKEPQDVTDNFFDMGGHSLLAIQMVEKLSSSIGVTVSVIDIFEHPTVEAFAKFLGRLMAPKVDRKLSPTFKKKLLKGSTDIAIIGMSCRFPGCQTPESFWKLLASGGCAIRQFTEEELNARDVPEAVYRDPDYVKAGAVLDNVDHFDAKFWNISEKEAKMMDPQQRLFIQCSWEAMESAGYAPQQNGERTGIFAGCYLPSYLLHYLKGGGLVNLSDPTSFHITETGNDKDYLTTRTSYLLNCKGPSIAIQTSCSTSLVAVATACQFLLSNQCDMAIAGASSITFPQGGYQYQEGHVLSPDGQCRAFDAEANGTVLGDGVGVLVLKRLEDAIADGDTISAVVKGFAINNDGSAKAGYSSPSVQGQMQVIAEAQEMANISPSSITYVEGHGTGTLIGDPIEVRALTQVFRESTDEKNFCCLGSVKPNVGHCNIAAGMAGLLKLIMCFQHKEIPPMLNFKAPNPNMNIKESPFFISNKLESWNVPEDKIRRAGISCFGIGGTNCHMILEEPAETSKPVKPADKPKTRSQYLLTLSAKTIAALEEAKTNLVNLLRPLATESNKEMKLKNIAYTLHVGREQFPQRMAVSCMDVPSAIEGLEAAKPTKPKTKKKGLKMVFMFPGQGSQYVKMGQVLYYTEPNYRKHFDACCKIFLDDFGIDVRSVVFADEVTPEATEILNKAYHLQPSMFAVEYSMAKLLMHWGVKPDAVVGHSIGEYTAACLAGIFSLKDAITLVVNRSYAMSEAMAGNMLSVSMTATAAEAFVTQRKDLWLSVLNSPTDIVLSGTTDAIQKAEKSLTNDGILCRKVYVNRAFHCPMMDEASEKLLARAKEVTLSKPTIPLMANLTGSWMTDEEALDPTYWSKQMTHTVRFAEGMENLLKENPSVLLEVGPSRTLRTLATRFLKNMPVDQHPLTLPTLPHPRELQLSDTLIYKTLAQLWASGVDFNWNNFHDGQKLKRLPLPTYAFAKKRCWPDNVRHVGVAHEEVTDHAIPIAERFHIPSWTRSTMPFQIEPPLDSNKWLLFLESTGVAGELSETIATKLEQAGQRILRVYKHSPNVPCADNICLQPDDQAEYNNLIIQLEKDSQFPTNILYLWSLTDSDNFDSHQPVDVYYHLQYLFKALTNHGSTDPLAIWVVGQKIFQVDQEDVNPVNATILGPASVLPQENPQICCRVLDILLSTNQIDRLAQQVFRECTATQPDHNHVVALRGSHRWVERFESLRLDADIRNRAQTKLKQGGTYIVTGGLGRIGLVLAARLAQLKCNIILTTRRTFPDKEQWCTVAKSQTKQSATVQQLLDFEESDAQVHVLEVDVGRPRDANRLITKTVAQYGKIDGIFHAAGLGDLKYLNDLSYNISEREFEPKVYGVLNLQESLAQLATHQTPEFVMLFSSMASILGGYGMGAYSAANRFMDAFVQTNLANGGTMRWLAVNWDDWQFEYTKEQVAAYEESTTKERAMTPEEGIESLERILACARDHSQILVCTRSLPSRVEQWLEQRVASAVSADRPELSSTSPEPEEERRETATEAKDGEGRLSLLERQLVGIYKEVLGVEQLSIDDNFFDLGGDSLLAAQIQLQVQRRVQSTRRIRLQVLFEATTVRMLAEWLAQPIAA